MRALNMLVVFVAAVDAGALPALALRGGKAAAPVPTASFLPEGLSALGGATTVGGIAGYCSGKAALAATQAVSVAVGAAVAFVALLNKFGYVTVNYTKVEKDLVKLLDLNKDGKVDADDYQFVSAKFVKMMKDNGLGSGAGFAAGFAAGFSGKGPL